jgi:hypothetical protein
MKRTPLGARATALDGERGGRVVAVRGEKPCRELIAAGPAQAQKRTSAGGGGRTHHGDVQSHMHHTQSLRALRMHHGV